MSSESAQPIRASRSILAIALLIVLLLVFLDQWTKSVVYDWLTGTEIDTLERDIHGHERHRVFGDWFAFMASCNPGAAFGQFGGIPVVLVVGRLLACGFLSFMLIRLERGQRAVRWAMVLVLSGAIGNVVDNLGTGCGSEGFPYGVRDFVAVWFKPLINWDYHFPSFNVADACISVGAVIWISAGLFGSDEKVDDKEVELKDEANA